MRLLPWREPMRLLPWRESAAVPRAEHSGPLQT